MNEEQLLQEARKEADIVFSVHLYEDEYGITKDLFYDERTGFIKGYIANANKQMSEAVAFHLFVKELALNDTDDGKLYSYALALWFDDYADLYTYFKQQKQ